MEIFLRPSGHPGGRLHLSHVVGWFWYDARVSFRRTLLWRTGAALVLGACTTFGIAAGIALKGVPFSTLKWQGMQNGHISPDGRVQLWRVAGKSPGWMVLSVGVAVRSEIDSEGIHRAVGFGGRPPGLPFAVKNSAPSVPMPRSPANASSVYFFGWPWRSMWSSYEEKWDYDVVSGGSHRACRVIRSAGPRDAFMRLPRTPVGLAVPTGVLWRGFVAGTAVWATAWWVLLVTPWLVRRAWRARRGRCVWCGYDCRAVPVASPCPECGTARPIAERVA